LNRGKTLKPCSDALSGPRNSFQVRTVIPTADRQKANRESAHLDPNLEKYNFILPDMGRESKLRGRRQVTPTKVPRPRLTFSEGGDSNGWRRIVLVFA